MKKLLLLSLILFSLTYTTKASHTLGGEIGWTCLANGKYVFYMNVYMDCTGIPWTYQTETIEIFGNPTPLDSAGNPFNTITMNPDSTRWIAERNGDTSPTCTNQYGNPLTCDDRDQGTVRQFFYTSDPITLAGTPSRAGWRFFWESACCRPGDIENMQTPGPLTLRAEMFRTKDADDTDPCIDSSPLFKSIPVAAVCRGNEFTYNSTAIDDDLDSLIYSWDRPYNGPGEAPVALIYNSGYAPDNPTPDKAFDTRNIPSTLNLSTGVIKMAVYSGLTTEKFMTVIQVDSYRDGVKIASVYREIPVSIFNCPNLPNGISNKNPEVSLDGKKQQNISMNFQAGDKIEIPIELLDRDSTGIGINSQKVILKPNGQLFSDDFTDTAACLYPPCAILKNKGVTYDSTYSGYLIKEQVSVSTTFEWQTDCSHLGESDRPRTFIFYYKAEDDHCPIPASISGTIQITLSGNNASNKASMGCIEALSGGKEIGWNFNEILSSNLLQWYIYGSTTFGGSYQLLDSLSPNSPLSYFDSNLNNKYYYVRAKNYACDSSISISAPSDTLKKENGASSVESTVDCILLKWDEERTSYSDNELRRYFIYRETPQSTGFELIDTVINTNQYCDNYIQCGSAISYFVVGDNTSSICNFKADTVSTTTQSIILNNLIVSFDSNLWAFDPTGNYQWYDCSAQRIIAGETDRVFIPKDTGLYALILSRFGCADTSNCLPFFPVGLEELPFNQAVSIFPNPTNGLVQIKLEKSTKKVNVLVRNIQGQLMKEERFNDQSFQLELPTAAGIYFIQLTNEKGEQANLKVVKQY